MSITRLEALERTVAALVSAGGLKPHRRSEETQATYMTVTPTGQIGAVFTGGVQIPEQPSSLAGAGNSFNFFGAAGITESMIGFHSGTNHVLALAVGVPPSPSTEFAVLRMDANASGASGSADVVAQAQDPTVGVLQTAVVLNSAAQSSFLQLLSTQKLRLAFGSAGLAFNGVIGQNIAIAHGLGVAPQVAGIFAQDGTEFLTVQQSASPDATNIYVSANVNGTRAINWIALG